MKPALTMRRIAERKSSLLLSLPMAALAAATGYVAARLPGVYQGILADRPEFRRALTTGRAEDLVRILAICCWAGAAFLLAGAALAWVRRRWALPLLRKSFVFVYCLLLLYAYVAFSATGLLLGGDLPADADKPGVVDVFTWRWGLLWPALLATLLVGVLHVMSLRRAMMNYCSARTDPEPALGDRILENVRTHGRDPRYRKSVLGSVLTHLVVLVIIPWLLDMYGCVENYRVPYGSGTPTVLQVQIVHRKKQEKKKYILRPNSVITFHMPDLDDSQIEKQVEEATLLTYQADPNAVAGRMGAGGGKKGGWPDGMKDARVRFIRLQYDGPAWDDGMDAGSAADINFLEEFRRLTGFEIARKGESHPIRYLDKYDKGYAPPFVYMTGSGGIEVPARDREVLRRYLLDGGMLFADCGSLVWHKQFLSFAKQLFPEQPLLVIADDDPIFQYPYRFPNGAPWLWHHGGNRALGIKVKDRWVVFYHPGDINDAWKTGSSGMDPQLARGAYQMGVNIVYYAFTHYLEVTRKYRK